MPIRARVIKSKYDSFMCVKIASLRIFFFTLAVVILPGCANFLDVKVSRFHTLPSPSLPSTATSGNTSKTSGTSPITPITPVFDGQHFGMVPTIAKSEDLEINQFARIIAGELTQLGLEESEPNDFLFDFTVSSPAFVGERLQPYSTPYMQMNCFRDPAGIGVCVPRTIFRTDYFPVKYTYYVNQLELSMMDAKTKERMWQGKAEATSDDRPNLLGLLPFLVRAVLTNFPGPSGVMQTIRFNLDKK